MKINRRGDAPRIKRLAWRVLEPSAQDRRADTTGSARSGAGQRRAWGILEAPARKQAPAVTNMTVGPALPDDGTVHFVLELALRAGEIQMATGAGAADVTATIAAITSALGLGQCEVDVIYTSITVTCHRGTEMAPVTAVRVVRQRSLDYSRLYAVERVVNQITAGKIGQEEAYSELHRINTAPHPYPRWVATLALGGMAASFTFLIGGDILSALLAFGVSALIDRVGRVLNSYALPLFFQQAVGGFIAGLVTMGAISLESTFELNLFARPSLVAAAAITVLLSGLGAVSAAQDAITGYNVTAAGRSMEVLVLTAGLITGVVVALNVALALGFTRVALPRMPSTTAIDLPVMILSGAGTAGSFALACYARVRPLLIAAIAGGVGTATYGISQILDFDPIAATAVAATMVGLGGGVISRRLKISPLVAAVAGITPLLPGLSTYRGLYELAVAPVGELTTLMQAVAIGLALAAGVVFGEFLSHPMRIKLGRLERRWAGPRLAGPLRPSRRRLD